MKRTPLWISAAFVVLLLTSTLFWNFSMRAASRPGPGKKGHVAANNSAIENFDIRDRESKEAMLKFERRMEKLSSTRKEKSANLKLALWSAKKRKAESVEGLEVTFCDLTNSPEVVEMRGEGRKFLTPPSSQPRESVVRGFINDNPDLFGMSPKQVARLRKTADYANPNGRLSWLRMEQRWNGMKVFQGETAAAFTADGEMVRMMGGLGAAPEEQELETTPSVSAAAAVVAAAASVDVALTVSELTVKESSPDGRTVVFYPAGPFTNDIHLELQYFSLDAGVATLAWSMVLWQEIPVYYTLVDAEVMETGVVWRKQINDDQTQPASYKVYDGDSPAPLSPTTALPGSGIQGAAIPRTLFTLISEGAFNDLGWLTDGVNTTTGNNADAGLDVVTPDGIDPDGRPTGSPFRVFDFNYNPAPGIPPPGDAPTLADYRFGEVVNMFFWSNRYHDRLYELGFTEAAGNFQNDNFGRGGAGNDPVLAQAQDFVGVNNANFATPPDGISGRMQMFVFTGPDPDRTSGLDQDVLLHELTHGTSNRLHNNAAGLAATMSRGMGEGWSDFYALSLLSQPGDDPHGIYAAGGYVTFQQGPGFTDNYYYGVRRFPYATISTVGPNGRPHNPLTFADIDPSQINLSDGAFPRGPIGSSNSFEVHNIGEIWCSALWEVRARIIDRMGFPAGSQRTLQLVTDGMKLDPVTPTILDARNSILAADCAAFGGQDEIDIWAGFAARGMGFSASAVSSSSPSVVEAFDMPNLGLGAVTVSDDSCAPSDGVADPGETLTLNIPLNNPFCTTPAAGVTVSVEGGAPVSYGDIPAGGSVSRGVPFTVPAAAVCGSVLTINVAITSSLGTVTRTFNLQIGNPVLTVTTIYASGNIAVPIPDLGTVDIPINVFDAGFVSDVNVRVRLDHTRDADLTLTLISPDGTPVTLANHRGGAGANFGVGTNDCSGSLTGFDDSAVIPIGAGMAPFTGAFIPESPLSAFNGKPVNGRWVLRITDTVPGEVGTVGCLRLEITRQRFACCGVPGSPEIRPVAPLTFTNESCPSNNRAPDPDETLTANIPLLNVGTASTTNLVVTPIPGVGVLGLSGPQTYGVLAPGATAVRPFTFTVAAVCGGNIRLTLAMQDGERSLGALTIQFTVGVRLTTTSSFSNSTPIIIPATGGGDPAGAPSNPYPSTINVSGLNGTITRVTAQLLDYNHISPDDVDVLLVGPGGQKILLMSDVGGSGSANHVNLTFDDSGPSMAPNITSGTFRPTNNGADDLFPSPAPPGPYPDPQRLSTFLNLNPNGVWNLFAVDDLIGLGGGNINGGWRLNITSSGPVCCSSPCTLNAPSDIVVNNDPGVCGAVVNYPAPTFSGSCGLVTSNPPSGSLFPVGTTTVTVKGTRLDGSTTTNSFSVTVNATTTTTVASVAGQYSDQVTLKANVTNAVCPSGSVEFKVNGAVVGSAPVISGMATLPYTIPLAQGSYPIVATYSSSTPGTGSSGSSTLTALKEDAVVTASGSNPTSVRVNSPGGNAGPITLCATINEASDGSPGDISLATPVTFTLTPVTPGAPAITQTAATSGGGVGGTLTACVTLGNVPVNVYDVSISVGGNHYTGSGSAVLAVYDPSLGFVTGGGTIIRDGVTATFGFNVKFQRDGNAQGSLLYIERRPTGEVKLKSNAMQSLSIFGAAGVFIGKATLNDVGKHTFRATVIDNGEPGSNDQFGLQVTGPGGVIIPGLTFDPITLSGGNIQVPHQSGNQATSSKTALK